VKLAVAKGTGVSGLSRYALMTELAAGTLEILKSSGLARVRRHFSLVHARDIPLSPPAKRFRDPRGRDAKTRDRRVKASAAEEAERTGAKTCPSRSGGQTPPLTACSTAPSGFFGQV